MYTRYYNPLTKRYGSRTSARGQRIAVVRQKQRALTRQGLRGLAPTFRRSRRDRNELKFIDTTFAGTALTATWAFYEDATKLCLNATAIGDTESTRDGREQTNKAIHVKGTVYIVSAEAQANPIGSNYVRLAIIRDKQANGAQGTSTNIFTGSIETFRNLDFVKRYDVVASTMVEFPPSPITQAGATADNYSWGQMVVPFEMYAKVNDKTNHNGTTAVIASITDVAYHLVAVAQSTLGAPNIQYVTRCRFIG